ncbi:MAG: PIN domain-containing protein [Candidatus Hydrogenedentes bacterium]|nr:PIN domain-containing protein [Candidatus Hydrogenedentota bacterium]
MKVLVDTSVWSLALRRSAPRTAEIGELTRLINDRRVVVIGPIRQELLSGIRGELQFERVEQQLAAFPDVPTSTEDYLTAARYFNTCRAAGVQGSNTDFLICAVAVNNRFSVYTTDRDFRRFARHIPLFLHGIETYKSPH